jgi:hypothetical protein
MTTQNASTTRKTLLAQLTLAGGAALAGSTANAQVTVVPVNETVGFGPGETPFVVSSLPGVCQFAIFTTQFNPNVHTVAFSTAGSALTVKAGSTYFNTPAGKKFSTISGPTFFKSTLVLSTVHGFTFTNLSGPLPTYLSFRFAPTPGGPFDYGWIELGGFGTPYGGAFVTIDEYAYDLSGAQLPNGQTFSSVPEPSPALALAALSALALGAAGVRRLKALRS